MDYEELYRIFYKSAIEAIKETGDAYKQLSWFGRNKRTIADNAAQSKQAA